MAVHDFFASDEFADQYDTGTGKPGINLVAQAIQFWSVQNFNPQTGSCPTVRDDAVAFRMPDAAVKEAVESHYWMYVEGPDDPTKQIIRHEGE
ncbi:hypothetical protein GJU93_10720 [Brucella sp. 10RB9212]|uniref:hypothetical protein n=1 Tax=unclassified Brucella TaxID=2632610 RepID=UPI000972709E|nr:MULTISPECIES: hypothetical protein [unclassified Brucella]APY12994.1 hypothetical protein BKD02_00565 [Brucella sp. 09RB8910]MRN47063.1 hypothetical protein [Brucella sp. 10RB9212]